MAKFGSRAMYGRLKYGRRSEQGSAYKMDEDSAALESAKSSTHLCSQPVKLQILTCHSLIGYGACHSWVRYESLIR